jgi:hypothetical protein
MTPGIENGEEWISLSMAVARMSELHPVYRTYPGYAHRDLESAIRAGRARLRGRRFQVADSPPVSITERLSERYLLDLHYNAFSRRIPGPLGRETLFWEVEIEWSSVAGSLRAFALELWGGQRPWQQHSTKLQTVPPKSTQRRQSGPKPKRFQEAKKRMMSDLLEGRRTVADLEGMLEKSLAEAYGGFSRDTARKARGAAVSEFNSRQIPTNDK